MVQAGCLVQIGSSGEERCQPFGFALADGDVDPLLLQQLAQGLFAARYRVRLEERRRGFSLLGQIEAGEPGQHAYDRAGWEHVVQSVPIGRDEVPRLLAGCAVGQRAGQEERRIL